MKRGPRSSYGSDVDRRATSFGFLASTGLGLALALVSCRSAHVGSPPAAPTAVRAPSVPELAAGDVDRMLEEQWRARGVVASPRVDDERFLRRVTLDIVGRIPTVDEIE